MSMLDTILNAGGGRGRSQLAKQFGLDENQITAALGQLVPALGSGVKRNTTQPGGVESLLGALTKGNHQQYLDNPAALAGESTKAEGNAILGHLLGSKDESRRVAAAASQKTGLDQGLLEQLLPVAASMVMGSLSKNQSQLAPGGKPSAAGLAGLLDADGDGSVADDIMGFAKKLF
ncbi:MAG: DUF937 domain-containing protein [Planctomycetota bacterium]